MTRDAQTALATHNGGDVEVHALHPDLQLLLEPHRADPEQVRHLPVQEDRAGGGGGAPPKKIAKAEGVKVTEKVLQAISEAVDGDLRQAINLAPGSVRGRWRGDAREGERRHRDQRQGEGRRDNPARPRRRLPRCAPEAGRAHQGLRHPRVRLPALRQRGSRSARGRSGGRAQH